ncbi:MAG: hypothetical protein AYK23_03165 [Candidatus Proteinoplasmatales archaeon SG8-5]|nr:MAG: hypothetical protein AYK23_03165 [Candidatus Proteinoplasmatales archaeon SG8-5]
MDTRKLSATVLVMAFLLSCLYVIPGQTGATSDYIVDIGGPAGTTFNDVLWEKTRTGAWFVGNDSANGAIYRYDLPTEGWGPLGAAAIPGNSYKAIDRTSTHYWSDTAEGGNTGWTTNTWFGEQPGTIVAEWKFNEGSGTLIRDSSEYNHDGSLVNANLSTCWIDGMKGKAINFDNPTDHVQVTNVAGITSGSFSGDCWIRKNTHTNFGGIVAKYGTGGWFVADQTDGTIRFYLHDGASNVFRDSSFVSLNTWHHLAWVYNDTSGNIHFYIDGQEDYSQASVNPLRSISTLTIGRHASNYFDGAIDNVRLVNRVITPEEIWNYYNQTYDLVGEWKFSEGSGTVTEDSSQHNNYGTLVNMEPGDWIPGLSGNTLVFDGVNESVDIADDPALNLSNTFTIEAWIYMFNANKWQTIVGKAIANNALGISYLLKVSGSNNLQIVLSNGSTTEYYYSDSPLMANNWYHVAVVATGSQYRFYVNGQPDGSDPQTFTPQALASPFRIGTTANTQYFDGAIDEVRIWNYSLSGDDINNHFLRYVDYYVEDQSRAGEWKLDEGSGLTAFDSGIYNKHGSLVNMDDSDWVDGISGKALFFDGVDGGNRVNLPTDPIFQPNDQLTLEAWVKLNETSWEPIITGGTISYSLEVQGGNAYFGLNLGGLTELWGTTTLLTGKWYHLAATYDGSVMRLYVNGVQDNLLSVSGVIGYPSFNNLHIGYYSASTTVTHGIIDEASIWTRPMNATEISERYLKLNTPSWHRVDPTTLPLAASGTAHGSAKSPDNIYWFGSLNTGSYDDGTRVAGSLVSPPIWMPAISSVGAVAFSHWFEVESSAGPSYDNMIVSIKNMSDPGWTQLGKWDSNDASFTDWRNEILWSNFTLGNFVQLNFTFDSMDTESNGFAGWHIDDIVIVTNDMMIVVGKPGGPGYSAYSTDGFSKFANIGGLNTVTFNDVAAGTVGATFFAVGTNGNAFYYNNTAVDFNGSYFFVVGYDSVGNGVAYYITEWELYFGYHNMHAFRGAKPPWKLNDVDWSNKFPTEKGKGLGIVVADGTAMSFSDPELWYNKTKNTNPMNRRMHAMVYVPDQDRTVLFGGHNPSDTDYGDTMAYDADTNSWQLMPVSGGSPPSARHGHAMAYDDANNVVVMFGGYDGGYNGETWLYDLANDTWTQKFPASPPSARWGHTMTYNSNDGLIYLFGGEDLGGFDSETWTYDVTNGAEGTWTYLTSTGPTARYFSAMSYDRPNNALILYGGNDGVVLGETWVFISGSWSPRTPASNPGPRFGHSGTFCSGLGGSLIFAGNDGTDDKNDIWTYDLTDGPDGSWTPHVGVRAPEPVSFSRIVHDTESKKLITFGGDGGFVSNETWIADYSTPWNGDIVNPAIGTNGENFTAASWDNTGYNATFIGNDYPGNKGVIYSYYMGNYHVTMVPDQANTLSGHRLYGIDFKPGNYGIQTALISGASGFKFLASAIDQSTTILIDASYPNIFSIDMWAQTDPARTSTLNTQVNADANYTFFVEANYTLGNLDAWNSVELNLSAWFDGGSLGILSDPPDASWSAANARTQQFQLYYNVANGTSWMHYPQGAPNEFSIQDVWLDPMIYGGPGEFRHHVYINVTFMHQTTSANGNNFLNGPAFGGRIWEKNDALNDPSTWDFRVGVYDVGNTGAVNYSYEEFGINDLVAISVTGNPTLNAPPGTASTLMNNPSQITYSTNAPYWVNVSLVGDLLRGGVGPDFVPTTDIAVRNANVNATASYSEIPVSGGPVNFAGPGLANELCIWGTDMPPPTPLIEPLNGTTACGPWSSNYNGASVTQVDWWAAVPIVPEGNYWTTITIRIETY